MKNRAEDVEAKTGQQTSAGSSAGSIFHHFEIYATYLLFIVLFSSCGRDFQTEFEVDTKPISIYLANYDYRNRPCLKIKYAAFSEDFLLYGTYIPLLNSPTGFSLRGRVIKFENLSDRVILFESPKGHSISPDESPGILLAEFPKLDADSEGVVIDFANGMNNAFTVRNVHSQGTFEKGAGTTDQFQICSIIRKFYKRYCD